MAEHMPAYHPMPSHLQELVEKVAKEAGSGGDASNTVFVITQAIGAAYAAGHRDGFNLTSSQQWVIENLKEARDKRTA